MNRDKQIDEMAQIIALKAFEQAHLIDGDENLADIVATDLYEKGYRRASEVAREIFEEIEKIVEKEIYRCDSMRDKYDSERIYFEGGRHSLQKARYWIAELKKKYTEGER